MLYIGRFSGDDPVMILWKCCIWNEISTKKNQGQKKGLWDFTKITKGGDE